MDPPVEVIIVLDAVNLPYQAATRLRLEVDKFLSENGGHLAQPVSIYIFASEGLRVQPAPSKDGNALAAMLDQSTGTVRARDLSGGVYSLQEQFQYVVQDDRRDRREPFAQARKEGCDLAGTGLAAAYRALLHPD